METNTETVIGRIVRKAKTNKGIQIAEDPDVWYNVGFGTKTFEDYEKDNCVIMQVERNEKGNWVKSHELKKDYDSVPRVEKEYKGENTPEEPTLYKKGYKTDSLENKLIDMEIEKWKNIHTKTRQLVISAPESRTHNEVEKLRIAITNTIYAKIK